MCNGFDPNHYIQPTTVVAGLSGARARVLVHVGCLLWHRKRPNRNMQKSEEGWWEREGKRGLGDSALNTQSVFLCRWISRHHTRDNKATRTVAQFILFYHLEGFFFHSSIHNLTGNMLEVPQRKTLWKNPHREFCITSGKAVSSREGIWVGEKALLKRMGFKPENK